MVAVADGNHTDAVDAGGRRRGGDRPIGDDLSDPVVPVQDGDRPEGADGLGGR